MSYKIIFDKKASKFIKNLENFKKEIFKNEIIVISNNPYQNEQLKGILKGIYSHHIKIIILALLKLGGIGFFITGISIIGIIDILFNNLTGIVLSTIIGLFFWISSFIITAWVKNKTNANTPTIPSLINVVLIIIGFVFFLFSIL